MIIISILEADEFGDEMYRPVRDLLTDIIGCDSRVGLVIAEGAGKGMIYRLLCRMSVEYPSIFFSILLSDDEMAYEGSNPADPQIFALDTDITYGDPRTVKQRRREKLVDRSDIVICRKAQCKDIRKINNYCDVIVM